MADISSFKSKDCPYYRDIPAKFAKLMASGTFGEMADTLSRKFPKIASDLGMIGLGSQAGEISTGTYHPSDMASIGKSDNTAQILFGYINSYAYAQGMGCLEFYYLGLALDFLDTLFGGAEGRGNNKPPVNPRNTIVEFRKGIEEKSVELAHDSAGFVNNYAFYSLPRLAGKGPEYNESDCIDLLTKDLKDYQSRIDTIRNIRENSISDAYEKIIDTLDIESTKVAKSIDLSAIDREDINLSEQLKKNAIADLIIVLSDARLNYNNVISSNKDFNMIFRNFITSNS